MKASSTVVLASGHTATLKKRDCKSRLDSIKDPKAFMPRERLALARLPFFFYVTQGRLMVLGVRALRCCVPAKQPKQQSIKQQQTSSK